MTTKLKGHTEDVLKALNDVQPRIEGMVLKAWCFPVNVLHIFRTPFLKNNSGRVLLKVECLSLLSCMNIIKNHEINYGIVFYPRKFRNKNFFCE